MKLYLPIILLLLLTLSVFSQDNNRIKIAGKIVVDANDKEAVTVFNTSSNKGTITDAEGKFSISVKLNDVIEISALQFQKFTVIIDEDVINSKQMTVFLVEQINKLDEVIIRPYDLTGFIEQDIASIKTFNLDMDTIYFGIYDDSSYEFSDDYHSGVNNIAMPNGIDNVFGVNVFQVVGLLLEPLLSRKNKSKIVIKRKDLFSSISAINLGDYYSPNFISESFNIPEKDFDKFIAFTESNGLNYWLLDNDKELEFLDLLKGQSELFLKSHRD
jgi:hypothetical protein